MRLYFAIIVLSLTGLNAHAGLVKWVDAEGQVHYSDTAPPEATSTQTVRPMTGKGQTEAPASFSQKTVAEREAEMKKARNEKDEAAQNKAKQDAITETKQRNCISARDNMRTLEESTRIVTYDAKGERIYLDDAAREKRLEEARAAVNENCDE
ncbi:MAG: DUF4124 domain-containing protein [Gammaproteobacteria bacterium]|nr:DUF4124 domain-containing protein [Gammaproteobacteria bacterium]MBU1775221.1 DUF4124 domain-containing protein [Gammaproteobacteria bacterium]MBU1968553.1 DUF4124 domain-containing protein [Gammaproteobacteria bacterium]